MINDKINATGELQIVLRDKDGNIKKDVTVPNLVVTTGKAVIASRLIGTGTAVMSHMAIGTGNTTPAASQTILTTEGDRQVLTSSTVSANEVTYTSTFGPLSAIAVTEAGIFNSGTVNGGAMLCRTTFLVVNKDALDTLTINWKITIN